MNFPKSGQATGIPDATQAINLLGRDITSGRNFFLQKAWFFKDIVGEARVGLFDVTAATGTPSTTALKRMISFEYPQDLELPLDFGKEGLKFSLGCVVGLQAGSTCTGITVAAGVGYEY